MGLSPNELLGGHQAARRPAAGGGARGSLGRPPGPLPDPRHHGRAGPRGAEDGQDEPAGERDAGGAGAQAGQGTIHI